MWWGLALLTLFTQFFSRWTIPVNISNNFYSSLLSINNSNNLIVDKNGNIHFIWYDHTPYLNYLAPQIYYKFYSPKTGFSENYCLSDKNNEIAFYPTIALDSSNNLHLIYVSKNNYYYVRYKLKEPSGRWTDSEIIDSSVNFIYPPSIAIFRDGRIGVTYCKRHNSFYQVFYKEKNEQGWQPAMILTTSNFHKYYSAIAVDQNNNVHIVWEGREAGVSSNQIFYRRRNNNNVWEERVLISEGFSRSQYNPTIIVDKENNIHITWCGYHPQNNVYYRIYYRYKSNNGNWGNIDTIAGANENLNRYRFYPFLTFDNNNKIYLVWFGQENTSYYKIWLRVKENNIWQEIIQIPDNYPNGSVYYPKICGINSDYLHLIFYDYRIGNSEIFYTTTQPYDIGINKIILPKRYNIKGILSPKIEVKNYFNTYHTFKAFCKIFNNNNQEIYADSQFKSICGLDSVIVDFKEYNFQNEGDYFITFSLKLIDDILKDNDTLSKIFSIGRVDIHLKEIVSPKGVILFDTSKKIIPQLKISNNSEISISFYLHFQIMKNRQILYYDSSYVSNILPYEERIIQFQPSSFNDSGNFKILAFVNLDGDVNPINNSIKNQFFILNKGSQYWYLLRDMPLLPSQKKVGKGSSMALAFDTLIFALKGNNTNDFYCYNINTGFWQILDPIPYLLGKKRNVKDGGSLVFDGEKYIYLIKGNNTREFWRYDIFTKSFEVLPEITGEKNVKKVQI
ncbi:MAG: BNR repeat-containing protein [candidate division WOR-3 bacterium]|nr:BNR repeat-containing protein [candidate division WOR-3 bacterium]